MLKISDNAAEKAKEILKAEGKEGWGLRIFVQGGGCCGPSYGMDIDERCVKMTRTALRLRGLNGYAACALSATDQELAMLPKPYAVQYAEAREAHSMGDKERVLEILADVRGLSQATLF